MYNFEVMDIDALTQAMQQFVREKGWYDQDSKRPQSPKNLAISLNIEASELLELFQWDENPADSQALASELADVTLYLLQLACVSGIDLEKAVLEKLRHNYTRDWDQRIQEARDDQDQ
jgi:NTP pyrophosphatase (non-canonical NTP hydrolase)